MGATENCFIIRYFKVTHRLLGIKPKYTQNPTPLGTVNDFDILNRQVIWQAFTEFFMFAAPFFRFQKLRKLFSKFIFSLFQTSNHDKLPDDVCVICHESGYPRTQIQQPRLTNCGHMYCYYCLVSQLMADPSYSCPRCGMTVTEMHIPDKIEHPHD